MYSFLANIMDTNKEEKHVIKEMAVVCNYPEVFPNDFLGFPPSREIEFEMELAPGTSPI